MGEDSSSIDVKVESMRKEDVDEVIGLIRDTQTAEKAGTAKKIMEDVYSEGKKNPRYSRSYCVAKVNGSIVGVCGLVKENYEPSDIAWIGWFSVAEDFQRKGIGTLILNHMIAIAREENIRKLFVETYTNQTYAKARNFYAKSGFKQEGFMKDYIAKGIDTLYFTMELESQELE
jgi:GNAT superfamily N-acetyltransferase